MLKLLGLKNVARFRLNTPDGAEFLFAIEGGGQSKMVEWAERINFRATLAPADQLLSFSSARPVYLSDRSNCKIPSILDSFRTDGSAAIDDEYCS